MQLSTKPTKKYSSFFKRLTTGTAVFVISISFVIIYTETTNTGLISYIASFFGERASANISQNTARLNSQTVVLLQAPTSYDPNPEKSLGTPPIVGNVLVADMALSEASADSDTFSTQISSYIVREGDTISGIAKMFNVSVNTIMWSNNISRASALRPGQTLIILPVTGVSHTIKNGDTIKGIALKYEADINDILQYNDLSLGSNLAVGKNIIIPDAEVPVVVPTRYVGKNNPAHDTNGPDYGSYYIRPVIGGLKTQGLHGYNGIDIAGPIGTTIYASAAGTVILSSNGGWNGGYGGLVIISHNNGTQTVYAHNSRNLVSVSQRVDQGEAVALMGATGKATGSHVHFEIRGARNPF